MNYIIIKVSYTYGFLVVLFFKKGLLGGKELDFGSIIKYFDKKKEKEVLKND